MTRAQEVAGKLWREVPGYEGCYSISDHGEVASLPRAMLVLKPGVKPYHVPIKGRLLARTYSRKGYPQVCLHKNGRQATKEVHRLVCETFHGPAPKGYEVAHLNGYKRDPRACNLAWVTRKENHSHKIAHGTHQIGERAPRSKFTAEQVREIVRRVAAGEHRKALAREFGVSDRAIRKIVNGESWAAETLEVRRILMEQEHG